MGGFIGNALTNAKKVLASTGPSGSSSIATRSGRTNFSVPATHEYSHTPYSMVGAAQSALKSAAAPATGLAEEAHSAGEGIASRLREQAAVNKEFQK